MEWLKSLWAKWKVQVSVVGGVIAAATAYGTCTYEPPVSATGSTAVIVPVEVSPTVEVSATTTGTIDEDGVDDTTVGNHPVTTD